MPFKREITSYSELTSLLSEKGRFHFLYMTLPDCGVCDVVRPKIEEMLSRHPELEGSYINLACDPAIGGQHSVFSVPAVLIFRDGRELFREARYLVIDVIEPQIERILLNFS